MRRKPSHPDAEGIADNGGDENGKHQRPAAKVVIEVHRIRFASDGLERACAEQQS
jgi:hypothetical protein